MLRSQHDDQVLTILTAEVRSCVEIADPMQLLDLSHAKTVTYAMVA